MNKQFWKDFLSWLDTASTDQLGEAAIRANQQLSTAIDTEVSADLRRMIRLIEEEMASRLVLDGVQRGDRDAGRGA